MIPPVWLIACTFSIEDKAMRELTMNEVGEVDGAEFVSTGIGIIGLGVALAVGAGITTLALPIALAASPITAGAAVGLAAVSYTHLTLPTIYSV